MVLLLRLINRLTELVDKQRLPIRYKTYNSYDVVWLCAQCHDTYETLANILKNQISIEFEYVDLVPKYLTDYQLKRIRESARALKFHSNQMPDHAIDKHRQTLMEHLQSDDLVDQTIDQLADVDILKVNQRDY